MLLPGPEPETPDVTPLLAIHRHADGVVTFHSKGPSGKFDNLFGIRAKDLPGAFPTFRKNLDRDSFFSVNAYWHPDRRRQFVSAVEARQPHRLRYLCAAYVDLDCHNLGLEFGAALASVIKKQDDGVIPAASVIVRSGRGMWLLWFLHDPKDPERPPRAFPEKLRQYLELNRTIGERLVDVGTDAAARDALRLMRVPGSIHPKARNYPRVKYWIQATDGSGPYTYTLEDLSRLFNVPSSELVPEEQRALLEAERPTGKRWRGYAQLNARRLREFRVLRAMRGGFAEGCRNHAALLYSWLLRCNRVPKEVIVREVEGLAAECRPVLSQPEITAAIDRGLSRKMARFRDRTISDWLRVTTEEAMSLEKLQAAAASCDKQTGGPATGESRWQRRHVAIQQIIRERGAVPSCREMVRLLRDQQIEVSHMQVSMDYKTLRVGVESDTR